MAGRSRCSRHGPPNPARQGPNPYGYAHQRLRKEILERDERCFYWWKGNCSGPLHLDHIIPLSMGGPALDRNNMQILCQYHNIRKGGANRIKR